MNRFANLFLTATSSLLFIVGGMVSTTGSSAPAPEPERERAPIRTIDVVPISAMMMDTEGLQGGADDVDFYFYPQASYNNFPPSVTVETDPPDAPNALFERVGDVEWQGDPKTHFFVRVNFKSVSVKTIGRIEVTFFDSTLNEIHTGAVRFEVQPAVE